MTTKVFFVPSNTFRNVEIQTPLNNHSAFWALKALTLLYEPKDSDNISYREAIHRVDKYKVYLFAILPSSKVMIPWEKQMDENGSLFYSIVTLAGRTSKMWAFNPEDGEETTKPFLLEIFKKVPEKLLPTFDREFSVPRINFNANAIVLPGQRVDIVIKNFQPGLFLQVPRSNHYQSFPLATKFISFSIPNLCSSFSMAIQLVRPSAEPDIIHYIVSPSLYGLAPISRFSTLTYPAKPLEVQDSSFNCILFPKDKEGVAKQIPEEKSTKKTSIDADMGQVRRNRNCVALILFQIRDKRRGPWELSNIKPHKIGKMRKIVVQLMGLETKILIRADTSKWEFLSLDVKGQTSTPLDSVEKILEPESPIFEVILIPKACGRVTISLSFQILSDSSSDKIVGENHSLYSWSFNVANHKYESSKEGKLMSVSNIKRLAIPLFPAVSDAPQPTTELSPSTSDIVHSISEPLIRKKRKDSNTPDISLSCSDTEEEDEQDCRLISV